MGNPILLLDCFVFVALSEDDFRADYRDHDYLFCWIRNRSSTEAAFSELAGGLQFHFR